MVARWYNNWRPRWMVVLICTWSLKLKVPSEVLINLGVHVDCRKIGGKKDRKWSSKSKANEEREAGACVLLPVNAFATGRNRLILQTRERSKENDGVRRGSNSGQFPSTRFTHPGHNQQPLLLLSFPWSYLIFIFRYPASFSAKDVEAFFSPLFSCTLSLGYARSFFLQPQGLSSFSPKWKDIMIQTCCALMWCIYIISKYAN